MPFVVKFRPPSAPLRAPRFWDNVILVSLARTADPIPGLSADEASAVREAAAYLRGQGAQKVWLFGSAAKGRRPTVHSDFDLAVEGLPGDRFLGCLGHLLQTMPRPVDLVEWERASEPLRERIASEGIRLSP